MDVNKFIPIKSVVGPGSQVDDFSEGELSYMNMPKSMDTYDQPMLPEPDEIKDAEAGLRLLHLMQLALSEYSEASTNASFDLTQLNHESFDLVNQVLGVGEVSATVTDVGEKGDYLEIQESVMAGVWRIRELSEHGSIKQDYLEIATIPGAILNHCFKDAGNTVDDSAAVDQPGTINAPSILVELKERVEAYQSGDDPLVINLSLLPVSEQDIVEIGQRLGVGPVTILSRGYGNCRIGSTQCKNVWWVKYYNSDDALILNAIEVSQIPEVAIAAKEDIHDSSIRMSEILDIYK